MYSANSEIKYTGCLLSRTLLVHKNKGHSLLARTWSAGLYLGLPASARLMCRFGTSLKHLQVNLAACAWADLQRGWYLLIYRVLRL